MQANNCMCPDARKSSARRQCRTLGITMSVQLVGGGGIEPPRALGHLIYSQGRFHLRATRPRSLIAQHKNKKPLGHRRRGLERIYVSSSHRHAVAAQNVARVIKLQVREVFHGGRRIVAGKRPVNRRVMPNSALMPDAFSSLRCACGAAKRGR